VDGQPKRINPPHRIRRIRIDIQPIRKPDREFADKLSDLRIIVPLEVVVQAACYIDVLPLRAKRVLEVCMYGNSNGSTVDGVGI